MHRKLTRTGLLLWLLHASDPVSAQAPDTLQRELKEVTITASRTPEPIGAIGRSVSVLDRQAIENTSCTTLGELLSRLAGIYLLGAGQTPGSNQTIFMRGSNSNQTAIYLDGVRINDVSSVNGVADLSELPLSSLDRIEILRGSPSTGFGSAAVGGVILLQSREPEKEGWNLRLGTGAGIFRTSGSQWNTDINLGHRWKNGCWISASTELLSVNGLDATVDTTDGTSAIPRDQDDWKKQNFSIAGGWTSGNWSSQIRYRRTGMQTDIDRSAYTDDDNYNLDFTRQLISGELKWKKGNWQLGLNGGWTSSERLSLNDSSRIDLTGNYDGNFADDRYTGQQLNGDLFAHYLGQSWSMLAGINASSEQMNQEHFYYSTAFGSVFESRSTLDSLNPDAQLTAPYLKIRLGGDLVSHRLRPFSLVAGIRSVHHSSFGSIRTFELNPSWQLEENSLLFASFSSGYNPPSLYQLYAPETYQAWDGTSYTPTTRGNKDLTPEYSQALEFGIRQQLASSEFSFSIFRNRTEDIIDYVYLWNAAVPVDSLGTDWSRDDYRGDRYINIGNQTAYGAELSVRTKLSNKATATASMSMIDGYLDIKSSDELQTNGYTLQAFSNGAFLSEGKRLRGLIRRPNTMTAGIELSVRENLVLSARVQYVSARNDNYYEALYGPYGALGRRTVDDYSLLDVYFHWKLSPSFQLTGRVENLLDSRYEEILGFSSRGRGAFLNLQYSL